MKRSGGGSRNIRVNDVRSALGQGGVWCRIGVVRNFAGQATHFEIDGDDVRVDVELAPNGEPCFCRLASIGGGSNVGFWSIPAVGTEVVVMFPDGTVEGEGVVIATLASGDVANGLTETIDVLVVRPGGQLLIHDGTSSQAVSLVTKADFDNHKHAYVGAGTGSSPQLSTVPASNSAGLAAPAAGTSVLKAK